MKKVLIISNSCWNAFHYRKALNRGLIKAGYQVSVLAGFDGYEKNLEQQGITVTNLYISAKGLNPLEDFRTLKDVYSFIKNQKPDIVFSFTIKPVLYTGLCIQLLRFIFQARQLNWVPTLTGLGTVFIKSNWITDLVKLLYRFSLKSAKYVVFQNSDDQMLFENLNLVSKRQIQIVPGSGIDPEEYSINSFNPLVDGQISKIEFKFLLIARMLWDKGILEYYQAAKRIKMDFPFARFQLLGPVGVQNRTAIPESTIQEWVNEGVIEYLPETSDVRPFIAKSDIVVLPSYREGLPKSLLEAACMGKPLIATDVPGCRDLLTNKNGILCQAKNSESLELAIRQMLQSTTEERNEMGLNSRELVLRNFTEQTVISKYLKLIE